MSDCEQPAKFDFRTTTSFYATHLSDCQLRFSYVTRLKTEENCCFDILRFAMARSASHLIEFDSL